MESGTVKRRRPERAFALVIMSLAAAAVFALSGCEAAKVAARAMEPAEATFADPETVMLRAVEPFEVRAEYYDTTARDIRVKKWSVAPPVWIVNEAMLKARAAKREAAQ